MLKSDCGKLMVYASTASMSRKRLQSVTTATERTTKYLNLGFEVVRFRKNFSRIYVYFENGKNEPIPIYCDKGKTGNMREICTTLKDMMFVLSFHPANSALRHARKELTGLS